jgi:hypothetical protein
MEIRYDLRNVCGACGVEADAVRLDLNQCVAPPLGDFSIWWNPS